jgi:membrane-associated protease RseP (regulator of RpoE activity)
MALDAAGCARQGVDPYSIGVGLFYSAGCPVFVGSINSGSPAERAGIQAGDQVLAVEGTPVNNGGDAASLIQSDRPSPVRLRLARSGKEFDAVSEREKRSAIYKKAGKNIISGAIVPPDTTHAEVARKMSFDSRRIVSRVFSTHYPRSPELFYGGFEIFMLRNPTQVTVGGIEEGPASKADVHWGRCADFSQWSTHFREDGGRVGIVVFS